MGVVNVTPDSFSDGGQFASNDAAVAHALRLIGEARPTSSTLAANQRARARPLFPRKKRRAASYR